ncbi:hypothetical protein R1flu_000737 [Riccia fluitans]|uniref:Uncharacterized protein n=1 Tax=Riccia fluitans TaxID=41844 RepID=A0ABD1Y1C1_9MARC
MENPQDDVVYYRIFPDFEGSNSDLKAQLQKLRDECLTIVYPTAGEYIWQHENFNLRVCSSPSDFQFPILQGNKALVDLENDIAGVEFSTPESFVPHLSGKVRFGDNLEDEWLVAFLLFEISRRIPSVSITVRDTDGEFLLIESAYSIPSWLEPERSHNRVFIRQGRVHFVPPAATACLSVAQSEAISVKQALQVLLKGGVETRASDKTMDAIFRRIKDHPQKALENVHKARCRLPVSVAHILKYEPQMISLAVDAFYNRDYFGLKAASKMEKFLSRSQDCTTEMVTVIVRMSRAMYAQLVQQVFQAPSSYPMPSDLTGFGFKEAELGMKIAVGFEMMYWERSAYGSETDPAEHDNNGEGEPGVLPPSPRPWKDRKSESIPSNDVGWQAFKASLEKKGYFKDLLSGSKEYSELLQAAVVQYRSTNMFASVSAAMRAPVKRTDELLSLPHGAHDFACADQEEPDSDNWLYDGEKELTAVMRERQEELDEYEARRAKRAVETGENNVESTRGGETGGFQVEEVVRSMQSFVNKISSFEGAELPDNNDIDMADNDNSAISLDMSKLLKELGSVFSSEDIASMFSTQSVPDDSKESSDTDLDEEDDDHERKATTTTAGTSKAHLMGAKEGARDKTKDEAIFTEAYLSALDNELQSSTLAKSFLQKEDVKGMARGKETTTAEKSEVPDHPEKAGLKADKGLAWEPEPDDDDENDLVDVDANLVESLLRSYMFQEGMPGPATNLLGAMGIDLPDNSDKRPGLSKKTNK